MTATFGMTAEPMNSKGENYIAMTITEGPIQTVMLISPDEADRIAERLKEIAGRARSRIVVANA